MNAWTRRVVIGTAAVSLALTATACGKAGGDKSDSSKAGSKSGHIGLLLPEDQTTRYEKFDRPTITATVKKLCSGCTVDYKNAKNEAATQAQQVTNAVAAGDKVLIIDPVDYQSIKSAVTSAVNKGVKVVAFDRFAEGPVSAYVSFDNEAIGKLQGQALLNAMGSKATKKSKIVMINGAESDPNAAQFKKGAHDVLDGKVDIAYEQSGEWLAKTANQKMSAAITSVGAKNIKGVYSANDGMAAGIATALKGAGLNNIPLTGQDAQIDGIQRIVAGTQSADIYKDYVAEGRAAAHMAVNLLQGKSIKSLTTSTETSQSGNKVPSQLLKNTIITQKNIQQTVIDGKQWTAAQICTSAYAADCKKLGLK